MHAQMVMKAVGCGKDKWSAVIFLNLHIQAEHLLQKQKTGATATTLYWQNWVHTKLIMLFSFKAFLKAEKDLLEFLYSHAKASIKGKTKSLASMKIMKCRSALILNSEIESKRRQSDKSWLFEGINKLLKKKTSFLFQFVLFLLMSETLYY